MIKHIVVTQEHIDRGYQDTPNFCPVYLAIDEVCKDVLGVYDDRILFIDRRDDGGRTFTIESPIEVEGFITAFDDDKYHPMVKPFEFDLDIPDYVKCD